MEKLSALSAEYETEKADLEKDLLGRLETSKNLVANDIVEQKASARHYVNIVNDFFEKTQGVLKEGLQSRRNAEKNFTSKMMEVIRTEYEDIVTGMRAEDRKKSHFERVENHKKLESCRIAVRMDLAAMLLQQRATLERQKVEEMTKLEQTIAMLKVDHEEKLEELRIAIRKAEEHRTSMRIELQVTSEKLTKRAETLEAENQELLEKSKQLQKGSKFLENESQRLQDELEAALSEKVELEQNMKDQIAEMQMKVSIAEETLKYKEQEMEQELVHLRQHIWSVQQELKVAEKERDGLRNTTDELQQKLKVLRKQHGEELDVLNKTLDAERSEWDRLRIDLETTQQEMEAALEGKQREIEEQDTAHRKIRAQLEESHIAALKEKSDMCSNVAVWLHDAINLRRKSPIQMLFHGSDSEMALSEEFFKSTTHQDLRALHKILVGGNDAQYANSPDRLLVSSMRNVWGADGDEQQRDKSDPLGEAESRATHGWAADRAGKKPDVKEQMQAALDDTKRQVRGALDSRVHAFWRCTFTQTRDTASVCKRPSRIYIMY
jgi:hypothetical protein